MAYTVLNAGLYLFLLIYYWRKKHTMDSGFILISLYAFVASMNTLQYSTEPGIWNLSLWPFIYLFLIFYLFSWPVLINKGELYKKMVVNNHYIIKSISNIYIIATLIVLYFYIPKASVNILSGQWGENYNDIYKEGMALYGSQIERISLNIVNYLNVAAIVIMFYFFTNNKISSFRKIIFLVSILFSTIIINIVKSSRGMLLIFALTVIVSYIIFNKGFSSKFKKSFILLSTIILTMLVFYALAVTVSRFGEGKSSSSLLWYFGQSFLFFNNGLVDSIDTYANGDFFFGWFTELFNIKNSLSTFSIDYKLGTHFGSSFFTFVGAWYIDFGPIGTLIIAIFFPYIINRVFFKGQSYTLADIFLFVYYVKYLMVGVFVIGKSDSLQWLMAFIIYGILSINLPKEIRFAKNSDLN